MLWWDDSPATRDRKHSNSAQAVITQSKTKILQCGTKNIKSSFYKVNEEL